MFLRFHSVSHSLALSVRPFLFLFLSSSVLNLSTRAVVSSFRHTYVDVLDILGARHSSLPFLSFLLFS